MKALLRKDVAKKRKELPEEVFFGMSDSICKNIIEDVHYIEAKRIFCFVSMGREVNTYPLLEKALADGKQVCVPIAKKKEGMYFVEIKSFAELSEGAFGVMEPQKGMEEEVMPESGDLFLAPGLVFDEYGNRYGYGGGFYDRYLEKYSFVEPWAMAFSFQMVKEPLEVDVFDIPMKKIVTEKGIWEVMR